MSHNISENIKRITRELENNARLIAVSKRQPLDRILDALDAGHHDFGENRIQDATKTWTDLKEEYSDVTLHMIGNIQSNKAAEAVALFDVIHTIDRPKIAQALAVEMKNQSRNLPCLIQVNTGEEDQKSGVLITELDSLYKYCTDDLGLNIIGLMCIPPIDEAPSLHFALLNKYAKKLGLEHLSMGMSNDYKTALNFGATYVRVGSDIFGTRINE